MKAGVLKFTVGRPDVPVTCKRCGDLEIDAAMGYNTWASLQGTQERACGDLRCLNQKSPPSSGSFAPVRCRHKRAKRAVRPDQKVGRRLAEKIAKGAGSNCQEQGGSNCHCPSA